MKYEKLFSPMKIANLEIKNRIVMAPMLMGFGDFDGKPTEALMNYYEQRAIGGAGLIVSEITRVNDITGASAFSQLAASKDYHIKGLTELAKRIKKHGAKFFVQLHHPGRQNVGLMIGTIPLCIRANKLTKSFSKLLYSFAPSGGKFMLKHNLVPSSVCPSKVEPSYFSGGRVRKLTKFGVNRLINQFALAAERVMLAGCDGVVLHAAHGYLIQQFLSPNTNKRTDEFGGSFENRLRFLKQIILAIRQRVGDFPIVVRLSVDECYEMIGKKGVGYSLDEGVKMAKYLQDLGIDAIDVSSAAYDTFNYWLEPASFEDGWRKYMAKAVKDVVNIPVIAANLIRSATQAETQIAEGCQDFVSFGRPFIADPYFPNKILQGNEEDITRCINCLYCFESMQNNAYVGGHGQCSVNPQVGTENIKLQQDGQNRKVVVIGAGPGGLQAAKLLALRGFDVTVLEKQSEIGGQVYLAANAKAKSRIIKCVEDLHTALKKLNVDIRLGVEATMEIVKEFNPYAVVVATGADPIIPKNVKGIENKNVVVNTQLYDKSVVINNQNVAVVGAGITGLGTAAMLTFMGNKVTIIDKEDCVAKGAWMQHVDEIKPILDNANVKYCLNSSIKEVKDDKIVLTNVKTKTDYELAVDKVVLSIGVKPQNALYEKLKTYCQNVYLIGDAKERGRIANATEDAYEVARGLK